MSLSQPAHPSRFCEICPSLVGEEALPTAAHIVSQLGAMDLLANEEDVPSNKYRFGWMAGASAHKLGMMREVLGWMPSVLQIENLLPMSKLSGVGLKIEKAHEDPDERDGTKIARDKLNDYWLPFKNFERISSCRRYYPGTRTGNCASEHVVFASDVNVSANLSGESYGRVFLRNPDETVPDFANLDEEQKETAIVDLMSGQYRQLGKRGWVTNTVEAALALRRPVGADWERTVDASGSSRIFVTMPLDALVNKTFLRGYIRRVVVDAMGTSRNQTTRNGVLNNIGGAAGGFFTEKMIQYMVEQGREVWISIPKTSRTFDESTGRVLSAWDNIRGHASGVPHILMADLGLLFTQRRGERPSNGVRVYGTSDFTPNMSDPMLVSKALWKSQ